MMMTSSAGEHGMWFVKRYLDISAVGA